MLIVQPIPNSSDVIYVSTRRDRVIFKTEPAYNLICSACKDVLVDPLMAPCGHSVCSSCAAHATVNTGSCATCGQHLDIEELFIDETSRRQIDELQMYCRNSVKETVLASGKRTYELLIGQQDVCVDTIRYGEMMDHEKVCLYVGGSCEFYDREKKDIICGYKCLRFHMPAHQKDCEYRLLRCVYARNGCPWESNAKYLAAHRKDCKYRPVPCPNGCGGLFVVGESIKKHMQTCSHRQIYCGACDTEAPELMCPFELREVDVPHHRKTCEFYAKQTCPHCSKDVSLRSFVDHENTCPSARIPCVQFCGMTLLRGDMTEHLAKMCPRAEVECEFKRYGCTNKLTRHELPAHNQNNLAYHLELLAKYETGNLTRLKELRVYIDARKAEIDAKQAQLAEYLTKEFREQEERVKEQVTWIHGEHVKLKKAYKAEIIAVQTAVTEQARVYSSKLLTMFNDTIAFQHDHKEFKGLAMEELVAMKAKIDDFIEQTTEVLHEMRLDVDKHHAQHTEALKKAIDKEEEERKEQVHKETQQLRTMIDDIKWQHNQKLMNIWDHISAAGKRGHLAYEANKYSADNPPR